MGLANFIQMDIKSGGDDFPGWFLSSKIEWKLFS